MTPSGEVENDGATGSAVTPSGEVENDGATGSAVTPSGEMENDGAVFRLSCILKDYNKRIYTIIIYTLMCLHNRYFNHTHLASMN